MRIQSVFRNLVVAAVMLAIPSAITAMPSASPSGVIVAVNFAPPPLPVYVQPTCPGDGYIWVPGYWAYGDDDYYWVPGTWVLAPEPGLLWTPGYWGWSEGVYVFHEGYWGPHVGFYGGINYGFGYFGVGFVGGHWDNGRFFYNRAVSNVNVTVVHNVYQTRVNERVESRVSFNGGAGGIAARPRPEEEIASREHHFAAVGNQVRHEEAARQDRELRASVNQGKPPIAATPRPGAFEDRAIVHAKEAGGPYHAESNRPASESRPGSPAPRAEREAARPETAMHPRDLPAPSRSVPNTGNPKLDQKYQQQQEKLSARQEQERQKLQQKQDQEHQRAEQRKTNEAARRQLEEKHQQQTLQLAQKHAAQQQHLQQRQAPPPSKPPGKPHGPES